MSLTSFLYGTIEHVFFHSILIIYLFAAIMSLETLPIEVWDIVIAEVCTTLRTPLHDACSLSGVCRQFLRASRPFIFKQVDAFAIGHTRDWHEFLCTSPEIIPFIQIIRLSFGPSSWSPELPSLMHLINEKGRGHYSFIADGINLKDLEHSGMECSSFENIELRSCSYTFVQLVSLLWKCHNLRQIVFLKEAPNYLRQGDDTLSEDCKLPPTITEAIFHSEYGSNRTVTTEGFSKTILPALQHLVALEVCMEKDTKDALRQIISHCQQSLEILDLKLHHCKRTYFTLKHRRKCSSYFLQTINTKCLQ